jgi:HEAT repeat protein
VGEFAAETPVTPGYPAVVATEWFGGKFAGMSLASRSLFVCLLTWVFIAALPLSAQLCPYQGSLDLDAMAKQAAQADNADTIYRLAAIAERGILPALQRLAASGMQANSVPGAAQVSLARLGDQAAMQQLEDELNQADTRSAAVEKLARVRNDQSLSVLMAFLITHLSDQSLYRDLGDASEDVRHRITNAVAQNFNVGPIAPNGSFSVSLEDWVEWWNKNKGKAIALSISSGMKDPYLQCLARKVEWGFPNAVLDLADSGNQEVVPILKMLSHSGDASVAKDSLGTLRGNAIAGLAKLGDEEAFHTIVRGLNGLNYRGAIQVLQWIGGKKAVGELISALGSPALAEQTKYRGAPSRSDYVRDRDAHIRQALSSMIANLPTGIMRGAPGQWKKWWASNRDAIKFKPTMSQQYE